MTILVITPRRYNWREMFYSLKVPKRRGYKTEVVSTHLIVQDEKSGDRFQVDGLLPDVNPSDYEGLLIVSGHPGDTSALWRDSDVKRLVEAFDKADLPIASICASVPSIRYALSPGDRVSVYPMIQTRECLAEVGALPADVTVTVLGNVATASFEVCAEILYDAFCDMLEGKTPVINLAPVGEIRYLKERKAKPWES